MPLPFPLRIAAAGILLLVLVGWMLYEHYLHPAWWKQRRVIRACEKAFDDESAYRLERLCTSPGEPSGADLFFALPFSSEGPPRYFTYSIDTAEEEEPDFSDMSRQEISLVRHYLRRNTHVPHHGKTVLRPMKNGNSNSEPATAQA